MNTFTLRRAWTAPLVVLALSASLVQAGASPSSASTAPQAWSAQQASSMKFGYSTPATGGMSTGDAVTHQVNVYGAGVVRRYYSRFPASWSTINSQGKGLPMNISFKMTPASVNSGRYDAALTAWFKAAPTDRRTWWSYMPEPEDDIAQGQYSASAFRTAFARIAGISRRAANPRLISTLTLMAYTAGSCGKGSTRPHLRLLAGCAERGPDRLRLLEPRRRERGVPVPVGHARRSPQGGGQPGQAVGTRRDRVPAGPR